MRSILAGVLVAAVFAGFSQCAPAQEGVDFELQLLEMEPKVADLLEQRLQAGGDDAAAVEAKLPGLVSKGTIKKRDSMVFHARSGTRVTQGKVLMDARGMPIPEGSYLECDAIVGPDGNRVDVNLAYERNERGAGREITMRRTVTACVLAAKKLTVLDRFERDGRVQVLLARATPKGAKDGAAGIDPANVWVRAKLLRMPTAKAAAAVVAEAKADGEGAIVKARAQGELVVAFAKLVRSGLMVRSYDEVLPPRMKETLGPQFDCKCLAGGGRIDVAGEIMYTPIDGGGGAVMAKLGNEIPNGGALLLQCGGAPGIADSAYVLEVRATAFDPAAKDEVEAVQKVVAAEPPRNRPAEDLYMARYPVRPSFIRVLAERYKLERPSAKAALAAGGVSFPEGALAHFDPETSRLTVRLKRAGHTATVKLINSVGG